MSSALGALGAAQEGAFFSRSERAAVRARLEALVASGSLPAAALASGDASSAAVRAGAVPGLPTVVVNARPAAERVFQAPARVGPVRAPRSPVIDQWLLGTSQVSFGRARWSVDNVSIFSVSDGKRLASSPMREPTAFEAARAARVAAAASAVDAPLVAGYRLLPVYSPGRALFWGSVLALWGTAAAAASAARGLGIRTPEDARRVLAEALTPYAAAVADVVEPLADSFAVAGAGERSAELSGLSARLRASLGGR